MFSRTSILHKLYSPLSDDGMGEGGILVKILRLVVPSILFIETRSTLLDLLYSSLQGVCPLASSLFQITLL